LQLDFGAEDDVTVKGVNGAHANSASVSDGPKKYRRPDLYINRETALVDFSRRVFEEAQNPRHPLLERVKFLAFVGSQLDEFLMVRVAGLYDQIAAQVTETGPDGILPRPQLELVNQKVKALLNEARRYFDHELLPQLATTGIEITPYARLTGRQKEAAAEYFKSEILPVLTPLGVDRSHPFPHISNRSLNLAVTLEDPAAGELFARIKVPATLRRLVQVPLSGRGAHRADPSAPKRYTLIWLEELISAHLDMLFPGMTVVASYPFRVLRDADIEVQNDEAGDLLATIEQGVLERRFGSVVTLTVTPEMPEAVRELLTDNLEISPEHLWEMDNPLGLSDLFELMDLDRQDLKDPPLIPRVPAELRRGKDPFAAIRDGDLLLHHPYDAFSSVADFIQTAARDPQVLAIKQTLYRVGSNSPIVQALMEANARGKQVAVLVELKARFDEENNIEWARMLEQAGIHVVYSQVNLKTHAKVALVVRREATGLQRYAHLGTGNYNASTARTYEDYALLTCRPEICSDVTDLFNAMTAYARGVVYRRLLVSPGHMRDGLLERIEREIDYQRAGRQGRLIFKTNALVDPAIIRALYRASSAGVQIDLIVRGICCLRPGIPDVSENIRVVSLVGRFLEHSRIYYFGADGADEIWLGSADLMQRNLDHRVEVLFPLEEPALRYQIAHEILPAYLRDTANTRVLLADGTYQRKRPAKGEAPFDVQRWLGRDSRPAQDFDAPFALQAVVAPAD
jgi:polyphosphate kinase